MRMEKNVDYSNLTFKSGLIVLVPLKTSIQQTSAWTGTHATYISVQKQDVLTSLVAKKN